MTTTETQPTTTPTDVAGRCEAMLQCEDKCCDPVRCQRPAAARVSFRCDTPECGRASHVLLLCAPCADQTPATQHTRRPL